MEDSPSPTHGLAIEVIQQVTPLGLTVRLQPPGGGPVSRELNKTRWQHPETGNVGFWMLFFFGGETSYQDPLKRYFLLKWGSLPEDKIGNSISIFICSQTVGNIHVAK